MKVVVQKIVCDVCESEIELDESKKQNPDTKMHQVIFTTEQTEGRSVKPYLSQKRLDLCPKCMETLLSGKMLFGSGAMGYNTYYFKKDSP